MDISPFKQRNEEETNKTDNLIAAFFYRFRRIYLFLADTLVQLLSSEQFW